jgi:hypothetical protein
MPVSISRAEITAAVAELPAAPVTITESLDVGESLVPSIGVPADIFEAPSIITDYNGKDEKIAIVIGTVIIGIWLLRLVMSFLPFVVGLGVIVAIFAFF